MLKYLTEDIHTLIAIDFFRNGCLRKINPNQLKFNKYCIKFDKVFTEIIIHKQNEMNRIDIPLNNCSMDVIKDLEIIFIELTYEDKKYHGAITLTKSENYLYEKIKDDNNCSWYLGLKQRELKIKTTQLNDKIFITI